MFNGFRQLWIVTVCKKRRPIVTWRRLSIKINGKIWGKFFLNFLNQNGCVSFSELQAAFRAYYKTASSLKHTPLNTAIARVLDFMPDDAFISLHPAYPKPAMGSYQLLLKKLGIFSSGSEASRRLQDKSDTLSMKCKKEAEVDKERFSTELKAFLERYSEELLPEHVSSIQSKLKKLDKVKAKVSVFSSLISSFIHDYFIYNTSFYAISYE